MDNQLEELIQQGQAFTFRNNSQTKSHGTYGQASDELLGWAAQIEHFIKENYGQDSGPYKLYESFDRTRLTGYHESDFNKQLTILRGALIACRQLPTVSKKKNKDDNLIISLLKNPFFWTAIVVLTGGAFALGLRFGQSKFDKEKSDYYEATKQLRMDVEMNKKIINNKDSVIMVLQAKIDTLDKK